MKARLDADGTAKPLTEIRGVFPIGKKAFYSNAEELVVVDQGTFECSYCGKDTPHPHSEQEVRELRAIGYAMETIRCWASLVDPKYRWRVYVESLDAVLRRELMWPWKT
jgi:hypothetical protein